MSSVQNIVKIDKNLIKFYGFEHLTKEGTIVFVSDKLFIYPKIKNNSARNIHIYLNDKKIIDDMDIANIIEEVTDKKSIEFFYDENPGVYLQMD